MNNYRPISVISAVAKVLERIIYDQIIYMRAYLNMTFSQKVNQDFALSILLSLLY